MEPFVGQIIQVGFNWAPQGYFNCDGQLLPIAQYTALFSLLGTNFGGNGVSNFGLPDLRGRVPVHQGNGPGLTPYTIGEAGGTENVTLIQSQMPQHTHLANANTAGAQASPQNGYWAESASRGITVNSYATAGNTTMNAGAIAPTGGSQPHTNIQPYLAINFCLAWSGIFPSRP